MGMVLATALMLTAQAWAAAVPTLSKPMAGWHISTASRPSPFPTIEVRPDDGRNAAVMVSVLGKGKIANKADLQKLHALGCARMLQQPDQKYEETELKLDHAIAFVSTFEDPDLVGKPPIKGNYKFTTVAEMLFDSGEVVHVTVFTDERAGRTFDQGMEIMKSIAPGADAPPSESSANANEPITVAFAGLDGQLQFPRHDFHPGVKMNQSPTYFHYAGKTLNVSGWLDHSSEYKGFAQFWQAEKESFERNSGTKIEDESKMVINGWSVAIYSVSLDRTKQWNLRACRTLGLTWADLHLSTMAPAGNSKTLLDFLRTVKFTAVPR
jgi:hypothetical protein